LLALFTGGVLLAGFAWYAATRWAWRRGGAAPGSYRRPVVLLLFGWLLCLGAAVASGFAPHGGRGTDGPAAGPPRTPFPHGPPPRQPFPSGRGRFLPAREGFAVQPGRGPAPPTGQLGNGKDRIPVPGVLSPRGIGMPPPAAPGYAAIKYRLDKEAAVFKAVVA